MMAAIVGIGFTAMSIITASPTQPSKVGVAVMVAVCVDEVEFTAANGAMLPELEVGSPIEERLFVQLTVAFVGVDVKLIAEVFAPAQRF